MKIKDNDKRMVKGRNVNGLREKMRVWNKKVE